MKRRNLAILATIAVLCPLSLYAADAPTTDSAETNETPGIRCWMEFDLKGWSVFYKTTRGKGVVTCDNGQTANVTIRTHAGGLTFGKSRIENGRGIFTKIGEIDEVFGSYAVAEAHAGVAKSADAQGMTKGEVSLRISGTGRGVDLGIAFGKFTIRRAEPEEVVEARPVAAVTQTLGD